MDRIYPLERKNRQKAIKKSIPEKGIKASNYNFLAIFIMVLREQVEKKPMHIKTAYF